MYCVRHNDKETVAACSKCGAGVCSDCVALSNSKRATHGILCADCYTEVLMQECAIVIEERSERLKRAVTNLICYVVGLVMVIVSLLLIEFMELEMCAYSFFVGCLLCCAYAGYRTFKWSCGVFGTDSVVEEDETSYNVELSGNTGKIGKAYKINLYNFVSMIFKVIIAVVGGVSGIIVTPILSMIDFNAASRLKKDLAYFENKIVQAKGF